MELETLLANHPSYMFYHAARDFGIGGPSIANFGTCAASAQAIGDAMLMLRSGDADAVITGESRQAGPDVAGPPLPARCA